jgi:prevent-host-death family protein
MPQYFPRQSVTWQHAIVASRRRITDRSSIFQLRVQLEDVRPTVWRRLMVPADMTLGNLHAILQVAFGWRNTHLHQFEVSDARYGMPDPDDVCDLRSESDVTLSDVAGEGSQLRYVYDLGDDWRHDILVETVGPAEAGARYPRCVAGAGAGPPEDVGGPAGFREFLDAVADRGHPEHTQYLEWIGGDFDPSRFDLKEINEIMATVPSSAEPGRSSATGADDPFAPQTDRASEALPPESRREGDDAPAGLSLDEILAPAAAPTRTVPVSEAAADLAALADEVDRTGARVNITINGHPHVVLISAQDLEELESTVEMLGVPAALRQAIHQRAR